MADPLVPRVESGRLYGRGAYDMKGGLAACLVAAAEAARRGLRGDVVVTAVVDEELSSVGTQIGAEARAAGRGDRRGADRDARVHRPQGLRRLRDRDARAGGARLAAGSRRRRDREDGPRPRRARRARPVAARAADASAARLGLAARRRRRGRHRSSRPTPSAACSRPSAGRCPARTSSRSSRSSRACSTGSVAATRTSRGRGGSSQRAHPFEVSRTEEIVRLVGSYAGAGEPVGEIVLDGRGADRGGARPDGRLRPGRRGRARRGRVGLDRGRRAVRGGVPLGRDRVLRLTRWCLARSSGRPTSTFSSPDASSSATTIISSCAHPATRSSTGETFCSSTTRRSRTTGHGGKLCSTGVRRRATHPPPDFCLGRDRRADRRG